MPCQRKITRLASCTSHSKKNETVQAINKLRKQFDKLNNTVDTLTSILVPLFPRIVEQGTSNSALQDAQQIIKATASNTGLIEDRFIDKVPIMAKVNNARRGTPHNTVRIKALLKSLKGLEQNISPELITDTQIESNYQCLKRIARCIHQTFVIEHPNLKHTTWSELGNADPTLKTHLTLEMEKRAYDISISLHYCKDRWAADRLLFEAFRGSQVAGKRRSPSGDNKVLQTGINNCKVISLDSSDSDCYSDISFDSLLEPSVEIDSFSKCAPLAKRPRKGKGRVVQ